MCLTEQQPPCNHEEELTSLKETVNRQKMSLDEKDAEIQLLKQQLQNSRATTPESLHQSPVPNYFQYNTGFTYDDFNNLCLFFKLPNTPEALNTPIPLTYKKTDKHISAMPLRSQLLLTLMKLRQNFGYKDLAHKFNIPLQTVSTVFTSWIDYMYDRLGQIPIWPHRDIITQHMSVKYKQDFPNTFAILDCTELKIEQPSGLVLQSMTYSSYKSANTLKALVACDPRGGVIFVSALFTGSISDKEIFNKCNIIQQLQALIQCGHLNIGDGLMTDKGFLIEKEVEDIGLKLNIPPFSRSNRQMPHADVHLTKKIAQHRVHVERAIGKIKLFKIISGKIPNTRLSNINQIFYVCSMLSNFQPHIIKDQ